MMNKKNGFNEVYLIDFGLARKVGTVVEKEDKKKGELFFTFTDFVYPFSSSFSS